MTAHRTMLACLAIAALWGGGARGEDLTGLKVTGTALIKDMRSGPGLSGSVLSPDGSLVLNMEGRDFCLWQVNGLEPWTRRGCVEDVGGGEYTPTDELLWSSDGKSVLMPTFGGAFQRLQDTDITVFDTASMALQVLTEDGIRRVTDGTTGFVDVAPKWLDADTIVFVRYRIGGVFVDMSAPIELATIERDGSGLTTLASIEGGQRAFVLALAASPDSASIAYAVDSKNADIAGVWMMPADGTAPATRIVSGADLALPIQGLAFSPDGGKLLMIASAEGYPQAAVLDLESKSVTRVTEQVLTGVGWAGQGHGLVYITGDRANSGAPIGVWLSDEPGEIGVPILAGRYAASACCGFQPIPWARNDSLLLLDVDHIGDALFVQLGR